MSDPTTPIPTEPQDAAVSAPDLDAIRAAHDRGCRWCETRGDTPKCSMGRLIDALAAAHAENERLRRVAHDTDQERGIFEHQRDEARAALAAAAPDERVEVEQERDDRRAWMRAALDLQAKMRQERARADAAEAALDAALAASREQYRDLDTYYPDLWPFSNPAPSETEDGR